MNIVRFVSRAQDLLKDRDFWVKNLANINGDDQGNIEVLSVNNENMYLTKKEDLDAQIDRLRRQTGTELDNASTNRVALTGRRGQGIYKLSANVQGFLYSFSLFVNNYAGIVEIIKAVDSQFGGLAWGTLSVFLSVAVLKQEREDEINRAILEFSRHCPRLKILKEIYPDEELQRHIAEMYTNIIQFARSATLFYQRGSIRRIVSSSNPKDKVAQIIEDIQTGLVNIRLDCETLMQQRVYELLKQTESLKEQLSKVNTSLERSHRDRNAKHLAKLKDRLGHLHGFDSSISFYRLLLSDAIFQQQSRGSSYPTSMTNNILEEEPAYNHWLKSVDAGILLLSGKNAAWINQTTLNWLSQAAILVVEYLKMEEKESVYVFCQTKPLLAQNDKPSIKSVFADVALQLFEKRPIDHQYIDSEVETIMCGDQWNSGDEYDTLQAGTKLINAALQTFHREETVFIVLDRIDQCKWTYETEILRIGVCTVLDSLLNLVLTAPCRLKIIVVSASTSHNQDVGRFIARRHERSSMEQFFERLDWDQD
jgi:hypothetical protein